MSSKFYAYGPERAGLETVMRLHAVKRWHMIDTTRQQTLAEHSANVALLAFYIAANAPAMYFGQSAFVATHALVHDLGEVFTGDVPSHTKRSCSPGTEDQVLRKELEYLEEQTLPKVFQRNPTDEVRLLIKLCDLADGIRFIRLHGVDVTARHAREGLEVQLKERQMDAGFMWPAEVCQFVNSATQFYAYELS